MPRLTTESFGAVDDMSWLGSAHGLRNARTETLDPSTFIKATHYPNGYIPSGMPVAKVGGKLVPYDPSETAVTGAGVLAGFVLTNQKIVGASPIAVPVLDHGRVKVANLPVAFAPPVASGKSANTTFVWIV